MHYVEIEGYLERKMELAKVYRSQYPPSTVDELRKYAKAVASSRNIFEGVKSRIPCERIYIPRNIKKSSFIRKFFDDSLPTLPIDHRLSRSPHVSTIWKNDNLIISTREKGMVFRRGANLVYDIITLCKEPKVLPEIVISCSWYARHSVLDTVKMLYHLGILETEVCNISTEKKIHLSKRKSNKS